MHPVRATAVKKTADNERTIRVSLMELINRTDA